MGFLAGAFPSVESAGPDLWRLLSSVVYYDKTTGAEIQVKAGFTFDLASIPKLFRSFVQKTDIRTWGPAAVHDYLYSYKGKVGRRKLTRKECDLIFYTALRETGVGRIKALVMYLAVRIGGSW